ncbi:rho guanine nucleotide exchange factor TIAM1-like isoform X2 [Phyllopteryx taeniolatus]|uniref:rho guanine nucleotide exchange factor TIAM1-like isoform X2 n=1 Tax=Phyllopteryx taeniolatus TaxID=161469 RepID=UPI002AD49368|nr:rho guanine nucleotide exchange factor TIAM1-like isoform X2 [Phyllopteryx taeniolatus]
MGNVESQNGENAFHGVSAGHLSRKHASSRSLRLSSAAKQSVARRPRHSLSAKQPERHRNSEASTRSSSTPSIPRSLAESGPEAFDAEDAGGLTDLGVNPHWTQRVAMTLRPEEHDASATPTPDTSEADTLAHDDEPAGFKKMRSKSADMWREDSLEFSLSDLSQEHMTSTEEMVDGGEEEEEAEEEEPFSRSPRGPKGVAERASSLDHLCSHQSAGFRDQRVRRRDVEQDGSGGRDVNPETGPMSPSEEDGGGGGGAYGAFTLPCRRSHCLSEGLSGVGLAAPQTRPVFQGRRAQTTQDISAALGEGSEYGDSGIDGVAAEPDVPADGEQLSRRCKAMSASFSVYSAVENALFRNGSDSGSSSAAEARGGGGGVYENFRKELDNQVWAHRGWDRSEEASSAVSDEQSSGTLSSAYPSESAVAASCAHGTVRKAGALAVKNFLVHKKGKKVEPAARRKWKHYWVSLKGCTLFLYESDGRSGIDHTSVPKHALWAENAIVQAVPEHPKKDFVFCLSNSAGDAFLFQVSARTEIGVKRRSHATPSRTFSKRRSRFSSLWGLDTASRRKSKAQHPTISQVFVDGVELAKAPTEPTCEDSASDKSKDQESSVKSLPQLALDTDVWLPESLAPSWVCLPGDQPVLAVVQPGDTSLEVLSAVCKKNKLDPSGHYLRLKVAVADRTLLYVPKPDEDVYDVLYQEIEICTKTTRLIQFDRDESCTLGYGFSVSVMDEDGTQRLHITDVKAGGLASAKGVRAGDEILLLNGKPAAALQMDDMRVAFACHALTLSVGALPRLDPAALCPPPAPRRSDAEPGAATTDIFSQSQEDILDDVSGLTVDESLDEGTSQSPRDPPEEKIYVQKNTAQVSSFHHRSLHDAPECQMLSSSSSSSSSTSLSPSPVSALPPSCTQRQLSHADKLRKVISELVDTEKTYVKDLRCLIECYLTPLQKESFLTQDELDILFGNLGEMVDFQVEFLRTLEDGIRLVPNLDRLERVEQFKKVLFSLGGSFLYYADRFKIYSAFCASHTKVPKVLAKAKTDPDFKAFLSERNPKQQHSSTLESYLIKPIQRVLKYPLLLRELFSLTDPDSDEHYHLDMAMKAMNKVASHINEMQKLHEEFGAVFDQLISEQKEVGDLSMGDLLMHSSVVWVNPPASLGKGKKDPELAAFVFKTAVVFVYKDSAKHRKKVGGSHRSSMNDDRDPFRFRHMIGTHSLQVRALTNSEGTAVCEIVHTRSESEGRPERTFQLCCSSAESKKDLLKAVHSILREKQRRQLLKTESLPLSQQYVPFGGKRLCALKGAHRPVVNRAASAPSRSLARRKLLRNRFTIDTDLVLDTDPVFNNNNHHRDPDSATLGAPSPPSQHAPVPSELWLEQQFDLRPYEDAAKVKETDILSDDDEYCKSRREGATATQATELDAKMDAMEIRGVLKACAAQRGPERDTVWVRREDYGCNRDVF